jgi:hypothetical protein
MYIKFPKANWYGQIEGNYDKDTQTHKEPEYVEFEIEDDEYFKSVNEFITYLEDNNELYIQKKCQIKKKQEQNDKIKEQIEDYIGTKLLPLFIRGNKIYKTKALVSAYKKLKETDINKYDKSYEKKYGDDYNKILQLARLRDDNFYKFIVDNKDEIFKILDDVELYHFDNKKIKRKLANQAYYEANKLDLQIKNKENYEKRKLLNPSEGRILLTDEEKRLKRIETNKKYYENKKKKEVELR